MNRCHPLDLTEHLHALFALASFAPDDDEDDDLSPAGDDEGHDSDGAAGEGDGEDDDEPKITPSEKKRLSDEAAKYRRLRKAERERAEAAEARVAQLEKAATGDLATENRTLHLRLAFERATNTAKVHDTEAAWLLVQDDLKGVKVDKGQVDTTRIGEIVAHVVDRYPYLVGDDDADPADGPVQPDAFARTQPSGRETNGLRRTGGGMDNATLARKFPALKR